MWWLHPEWKEALCPQCGRNIWATGGDPDWGECYDCRTARQYQEQQSRPSLLCDICGSNEAVTDVKGYAVCSEACAHAAADLPVCDLA